MVFSSTLFLFLFLPVTLCVYFAIPRRFRNAWLLLTSLVFYGWGEPLFLPHIFLACLINYGFAILVDKFQGDKRAKWTLIGMVTCNLAFLGYYKYTGFLVENVNSLLSLFGSGPLKAPGIIMPIGISFFTFQCMSYVIDIYRKQGQVQRNPMDMLLYALLFPQLIAGPIVCYRDVCDQLRDRRESLEEFGYGVQRFIIGMAKKMLIANTVALQVDTLFAKDPSTLGSATLALGAVLYFLQIFFDFSGYSDMAIGLGHMFGFRFKENFNFPYTAKSITEFWRRWHISLSTWFRDYLYIPLGGNRHGAARTYANLVAVFLLCGLWHGANWTFIVWGAFHGALLVLERQRPIAALLERMGGFARIYTTVAVIFGWIFFRADNLDYALRYIKELLRFSSVQNSSIYLYLTGDVACAVVVGCVAAYWPAIASRLPAAITAPSDGQGFLSLRGTVLTVSLLGLFTLSVLAAASGAYNPFIYFRF